MIALSGGLTSHGASQGIPVSVTLDSMTVLDTSGCLTGASGVTTFTDMLPDATQVTPTACSLTFGSNNDTSRLRMYQSDLAGKAMFGAIDGARETTMAPGGDRWVELDPTVATLVLKDGGFVTIEHAGATVSIHRFDNLGNVSGAFGTAGTKTLSVGTLAVGDALFEDSRGRILLTLDDGATFSVLRINGTTGAEDATFGTSGYANFAGSIAGGNGWGEDIEEVDDSYLITAGYSFGANTYPQVMAVLTANGALNRSWGTEGLATATAITPATAISIADITTDLSGRVYSASTLAGGSTIIDRYTSAGAIDATWGTAGRATMPGEAVVDFQIDVAGDALIMTQSGAPLVSLTRFDSTGTLVPTWGAAGVMSINPNSADYVMAGRFLLDPDGTITIPEMDAIFAPLSVRHGMIRLTATGAYDPSFDGDGKQFVTDPFPGTVTFSLYTISRGSDGTVHTLSVGDDVLTTNTDVLLAGYTAPTVDNYLNVGGGSDRDFSSGSSTSFFGACLLATTNATASWTTTGACGATDVDPWNAIAPNAASGASTIATTATSVSNATASLKFALHGSTTQKPVKYMAPITFDLVAPSV